MVIINSIIGKFVLTIGGTQVFYTLFAMIFVVTFIYIFYKIST